MGEGCHLRFVRFTFFSRQRSKLFFEKGFTLDYFHYFSFWIFIAVRIVGDTVTVTKQARSFNHLHGTADIYSISYGNYDSGKSYSRISLAAYKSILKGINQVKYIPSINYTTFLIKANFIRTATLKLVKKVGTKLEHFGAGKFKNKKFNIRMISISFKNLVTRKRSGHCESHLFWCNRMFHWDTSLHYPQE